MMRTLFLQAPSYDGYDGGAGAREIADRTAVPEAVPRTLKVDDGAGFGLHESGPSGARQTSSD